MANPHLLVTEPKKKNRDVLWKPAEDKPATAFSDMTGSEDPLREHVRRAIQRISQQRELEAREASRAVPDGSPRDWETFTDSRISVTTRRISGLNPREDIVCVCPLGNDRYSILLGDFTGHNGTMNVGYLFMRSRIEPHLAESSSPSEALSNLNQELCNLHAVDFMTAVAVTADLRNRRLEYSVAGGHPPLHRRWGRLSWRILPGHGIPLGIRAGEKYTQEACSLVPGDKVLLFSDGLLKIRGGAGSPVDTEAALQGIDSIPANAAPSEVLDEIQEFVKKLAGSRQVADEVTATLIQV